MATELDKYYDSPTVGPICYYTKDLVVVELWSVIRDRMPDWKEFKIEIKVYLVVKKIHFTFLKFILKLKPPTLASGLVSRTDWVSKLQIRKIEIKLILY